MITISHIILAVFVFIIIFWLFEQMNQKYFNNYNEAFIQKTKYTPAIQNFIIPETNEYSEMNKLQLNIDSDGENYLQHLFLKGSPAYCPKPVKSIKQFNKDFFKFRDYIENNSSMHVDPVDKINAMRLDGTLDKVNNGMKIKDIYDNLTGGINLYDKPGVRIPKFDNTMNDGFNFNFQTGLHNTRDEWEYPNDKEMNTGRLEYNLFASDPEDLRQMPYIHKKANQFAQ